MGDKLLFSDSKICAFVSLKVCVLKFFNVCVICFNDNKPFNRINGCIIYIVNQFNINPADILDRIKHSYYADNSAFLLHNLGVVAYDFTFNWMLVILFALRHLIRQVVYTALVANKSRICQRSVQEEYLYY